MEGSPKSSWKWGSGSPFSWGPQNLIFMIPGLWESTSIGRTIPENPAQMYIECTLASLTPRPVKLIIRFWLCHHVYTSVGENWPDC